MSSKREPVSVQFSASKQGTDKSKDRTGSGTSFPIRYRSLEDYDDEELTILTGQYDKQPEKEERIRRSSTFASVSPSSSSAAAAVSSSSSSSPSKNPPPLPPKFESKSSVTSSFKTLSGDVRDDKKTLLANIRGKIHKKWEELSGESSSSPENENEKCPSPLRKQNSDESTTESSSQVPPKVLNLKSTAFEYSADLFPEIESAEELTEELIPENGSANDELSIDENVVVEEEPVEESESGNGIGVGTLIGTGTVIGTSGGGGITFEPIPHSPSHSTRSTLRERIRGNPPKNIDTTPPIVMSSLLTEEVIDNDGRIYYDAEDEEEEKEEKPITVEKVVVPVQQPRPLPPKKPVLKERKLPLQRLVIVVLLLFAYLLVPLPSYVAGIITGAIITSALWMAYLRFLSVYRSAYRKDDTNRPGFPVTPRLDQLPALLVPEMKDPKLEDIQIYKGWMNELYYYDADNYHINKTNSVYVRLEGVSLRLSSPKVNVPKRAMYDEMLSPPNFIHQRHYDMKASRVFLQPAGLVKKRLWSKKYPICVALSESNFKKSAATPPQKPLSKVDSFSQSFDMGFEVVTEQSCNSCILYLFARTGREKEEWFKRFQAAAKGDPLENHILEIRKALKDPPQHKRSDSDTNITISEGIHKHRRHSSMDSNSSTATTPSSETTANESPKMEKPYEIDIIEFSQYMAKLMPATTTTTEAAKPTASTPKSRRESSIVSTSASASASASASTTPSSPTARETPTSDLPPTIIDSCEPQLLWMNALIGRCLWDFLQDKSWTEKVMEKLQRKLSKIHVPYFIEELKITDIDLGTAIPVIQRSSKPYLDERGFWVDLQTTYSGGFKMTIATKVNLMKLKKSSLDKSPESSSRRSAVTDSNEEDSAESSTDEEPDDNGLEESSGVPPIAGGGGSAASRKILKYINKITQSKYFQQATEYKYIKMAMEEVSNTPLILTVEVHNLNGTLTVNVPPPPTDRLWYGFRENPVISLVAKPKVGEREVTVTHVTDWIEKKLIIEFQRIFVRPNMDDLVIPVLLPGLSAEALPTTICPPDGTEV